MFLKMRRCQVDDDQKECAEMIGHGGELLRFDFPNPRQPALPKPGGSRNPYRRRLKPVDGALADRLAVAPLLRHGVGDGPLAQVSEDELKFRARIPRPARKMWDITRLALDHYIPCKSSYLAVRRPLPHPTPPARHREPAPVSPR